MIFINNGRSVYESLQFQYQRVAMMATHLAQLSLILKFSYKLVFVYSREIFDELKKFFAFVQIEN